MQHGDCRAAVHHLPGAGLSARSSDLPRPCRPNTSGRWGIWGHDQSDLQLCSMKKLEQEGVWVLSIDS